MTFLLSEDKALREKLQGMVVHDQKADSQEVARQVGVWFGQPDQEIRSQSYPYVTIDMIGVDRDTSREHRGTTNVWYLDPGTDSPTTQDFTTNLPIPVQLTYQITTYSRHPRHDRAIMAQLMAEKLPIRFGYLSVETGILDEDENPQHTLRRLDVLGVSKRDNASEQAKRLFVNAITVQVSSEVSQSTLTTLYKAQEVNVYGVLPENAGGRPGQPYFTGIDPFTLTTP